MTNATKKVNLEKAVIVNAAVAAPAVVVVADTKATKARAVFAQCYPDGKTTTMARKDIIAKLQADAGLTKAGAGTYLQNLKSKAGIVVKREAAPAVAAA